MDYETTIDLHDLNIATEDLIALAEDNGDELMLWADHKETIRDLEDDFDEAVIDKNDANAELDLANGELLNLKFDNQALKEKLALRFTQEDVDVQVKFKNQEIASALARANARQLNMYTEEEVTARIECMCSINKMDQQALNNIALKTEKELREFSLVLSDTIRNF